VAATAAPRESVISAKRSNVELVSVLPDERVSGKAEETDRTRFGVNRGNSDDLTGVIHPDSQALSSQAEGADVDQLSMLPEHCPVFRETENGVNRGAL